ncbi:MAG: hypothetical protein KAX84_19275 [Burkholderiales bacterium]|nr:hypothetical protein [Burkholderiales bacterium]
MRIILAVLLFAFNIPVSAQGLPSFTNVYFFGASNLDTGNFLNHPFWKTQSFAPIPANGYYMGRWQSGPVWADEFASALGRSAIASSNGGTNYAFGAAGTSPHPGETPAAPGSNSHALYFSTQIDQILADKAGVLDSAALYVVAIGDNDPPIFGRTPAQAPTAAGVVITQLERLRTAGARQFLVRTLPPGQDPYATPFNNALLQGVATLRSAGAVVYVVSAAAFVQERLTVAYLAGIGITNFGNCRANAACQAGAKAAAEAGQVFDHEYLFFDNVGPHFNHAVHKEIAQHALLALGSPVVEFFNSDLVHYFMTIDPAEAAAIDSGAAGPGWSRTGKTLTAYKSASGAPAGVAVAVVCRFYGNQANGGPNSHFYTAEVAECDAVKQDQGWTFERNEFFVIPAVNGACPNGGVPVYRVYNGRFAERDSNHRYMTDIADYNQMIAQGWRAEGVVFCGA